jgi:hypothetical protein
MSPQPSPADDAALVLTILGDGPAEGLSLDEIRAEVGRRTGEAWSLRTANVVLCGLMSQVKHHKVRQHGAAKVSKFYLKIRAHLL